MQRSLAEQFRPQTAADFVGQSHLWGPQAALRRMVEADNWTGLIFWGPPGCGKTSLAQIIAQESQAPMVALSAVLHGVKEIRASFLKETSPGNSTGASTGDLWSKESKESEVVPIVFLDEIHRLNKSQQDVLLPAVETGQIRLIGATTENPSIQVNNALLSRCIVCPFKPLKDDEMQHALGQALLRPGSPLAGRKLGPAVITSLAKASGGDLRRGLNHLQLLCTGSDPQNDPLTLRAAQEIAGSFSLVLRHDAKGDLHYDLTSAFIKSIRSSDPDAALYYLARLLEGGDDPMFIARRLVTAASEDIGNANPMALLIASATLQAVEKIGLPEARINLAQATTYLAASPKSNRSYQGINLAAECVAKTGALEVPEMLRNSRKELMKQLGYGKGYRSPHESPNEPVSTDFLPDQVKGTKFYHPLLIGAEAQLARNLEQLRPSHPDPGRSE